MSRYYNTKQKKYKCIKEDDLFEGSQVNFDDTWRLHSIDDFLKGKKKNLCTDYSFP